ncbi:hypothetical protein AcV7_003708 [Taiwanofungus camphoratus]|nr:hypothetical protein AcV7_003708 [Antrodia cinnamomea]
MSAVETAVSQWSAIDIDDSLVASNGALNFDYLEPQYLDASEYSDSVYYAGSPILHAEFDPLRQAMPFFLGSQLPSTVVSPASELAGALEESTSAVHAFHGHTPAKQRRSRHGPGGVAGQDDEPQSPKQTKVELAESNTLFLRYIDWPAQELDATPESKSESLEQDTSWCRVVQDANISARLSYRSPSESSLDNLLYPEEYEPCFGELSPVPNTPFISQTALETPSWSSAATDSKVLELVPNDSGQTSVETNNVIDAVRPYSIQDIERVPGRVMYSPSTGQPLGVPESVQLPSCVPRIKKTFKRSTPIACFFCRKRKIACGGPPKNSSDKTCGQCARRNQECTYPQTSHRGFRFKECRMDNDQIALLKAAKEFDD